uniref:Transmembrane protein 97 n=1 Tax=Nomascus leucogenys TaxID=61853 RepID=A0A2I3GRP8_NOMLE
TGAPEQCHCMEWLPGLCFLSHISITLFMDLQAVLPCELYPVEFRNLLKWYAKEFKDTLLQEPPAWFKPYLFCKLGFQVPFFPIATYAFLKGSFHTMMTLIPLFSTFLFEDFSKASDLRLHERLTPVSVYAPYLLIPFILLIFMLQRDKKKKMRETTTGPG